MSGKIIPIAVIFTLAISVQCHIRTTFNEEVKILLGNEVYVNEVYLFANLNASLQSPLNFSDVCQNYQIIPVCKRDPTFVNAYINFKNSNYDVVGYWATSDDIQMHGRARGLPHNTDRKFRLIVDEELGQSCYYFWFQSPDRIQVVASIVPIFYDCRRMKIVERETTEFVREVGTDVTFNCWNTKLDGNFTVIWFLLSPASMQRQIITSTNASYANEFFTINNVSSKDVGLYQCFVWFPEIELGYEKNIKLILPRPPIEVSNLEAPYSDIKDTSVKIAWSRTADDFRPTNQKPKFKVTYYPLEESETNQSITVITDKEGITLDELRRKTMYMAQVQEMNAYGESEPKRVVFLTKNSSTDQHDLKIFSVIDRPMIIQCHNNENDTKSKWKMWSDNDRLVRNNSRLIIDKVGARSGGTYYCVKFFDVDARFEFRIEVIVTAMPPEPDDFRCSSTTNGSLTLTWVQQEKYFEYLYQSSVNQKFDKYKLKYFRVGAADGWNETFLPKEQRQVTLDQLVPKSIYLIQLSAFNEAGGREEVIICKVE